MALVTFTYQGSPTFLSVSFGSEIEYRLLLPGREVTLSDEIPWVTRAIAIADEVPAAPLTPAILPPILEAIANPQGLAVTGALFTQAVSNTGGAERVRYSAVGLPSGAAINPTTGVIIAVLETAGSFSVTITAQNPGGSDSTSFTLAIAATLPDAPDLSSIADIVAIADSSILEVTPTNVGGSATSWTGSSLPSGFTVNPSTGVFSGVLDVAATFSGITITATNPGGEDSVSFNLQVDPLPVPVLEAIATQSPFADGSLFSLQAINSGASATSWSVSGQPAGWSINNSGLLTGNVTTAAVSTITITATNENGSDDVTFTLIAQSLIPEVIRAGGQSNYTGLQVDVFTGTYPTKTLFYDGVDDQLKVMNPVNGYRDRENAELYLALELEAAFPEKQFIFVSEGTGGTGFDNGDGNTTGSWGPGRSLRTIFMDEQSDSMAKIFNTYGEWYERGMIWVQGEHDARNTTAANAYDANVSAFYAELRGATIANLPIYAVRLHTDLAQPQYAQKDTVNTALTANSTNMIVPDALTLQADDVHYDTAGMIGLASLMRAEVMASSIYLNAVPTPADTLAPTLQTADVIPPREISLTYDEPLDDTVVPAASDFSYTGFTFTSVAIAGAVVTLTTTADIVPGTSETLAYTPGANRIQDDAGNEAIAFSLTVARPATATTVTFRDFNDFSEPTPGTILASTGGAFPKGCSSVNTFASGDYVEFKAPDISNGTSLVITFSDQDDLNYANNAGQTSIVGVSLRPTFMRRVPPMGQNTDITGHTVGDGSIFRLSWVGDDTLIRYSNDNGASFTTAYTYSGIMAGKSSVFVKAILGFNAAKTLTEFKKGQE